jgi:penicillin-binding protein 2
MDQQQESISGILRRLPLLAAFFILLSAVLFIRLWYIQAIKGEYYHEQAENNRIRPVKLRPPRGIIYDRSGRPLVENELVFDVSLIPEDALNIDATIEKLSAIVKIAPDSIRKALDDANEIGRAHV